MENAALNVTKEVMKQNPKSVLVFAGKGNNGGDGLATSRQLITRNVNVKIFFIGDKEKATPDCRTNLDILENFSADIEYLSDAKQALTAVHHCDIIIDALIGTGLKRRLSDLYSEIADIINNSGKYVISVDCPTGINTDTGEDYGIAVNANKTVTFHCPKTGMLLYPAYSHIGDLVTGDIGMPYGDTVSNTYMLTEKGASDLLPQRSENSHKGSYGKAVLISGCDTMTGAAVFNTKAAYKTGCGLVNICSTKHCISTVQLYVPEAVTTILPDTNGYISDLNTDVLKSASALAIGSGLGCTNYGIEVVKKALESDIPTVVDADALNIVAKNNLHSLLNGKIITPHIKEMSRLNGLKTADILADMIGTAKEFSKKYGCITVLKSSHSVIASPDGKICINTRGCNAMSKGGSGDCLTGIIVSLLAQGTEKFNAATLGAYINGLSGEITAEKLGQYSVTASDMTDNIYKAIEKITQ
jgi:NAD(P)H-hydrate epimerase